MPQPLTTVVGGGLAGISAALDLAMHGFPVRLIESKRRLGGRTGSFLPGGSNEVPVDYCQHVGMGCCHGLQKLIRMLDQENQWQRQEVLHFYSEQGYQALRSLPLLPAPLHLTSWLLRWPKLSVFDRIWIARALLKMRAIRDRDAVDHVAAEDWLREQRQSQTAIKHFWSTIIVSALGEEIDQVSLASVAKVLQDGFLNDRRAFHLLVPQKPLDVLFHQTAAQKLRDCNVELIQSESVQAIQRVAETQGAPGFSIRTNKSQYVSDQVILAVPWHQLGRMDLGDMPCREKLLAAETNLDSSPITGVHTWWDSPWLNTPHASIVGQLCQWVFPHPRESSDDDSETYYQIVISASRSLPSRQSNEGLSQLIHQDLCAVFPQVEQARLLRLKVVTDPLAVFSVRPGSLRFRPETELEPGLMVAGDWTNTGWPATMEGAILSGFKASKTVQESARS